MTDHPRVRALPDSGLHLVVCDRHRVFADALAAFLTASRGIAGVRVAYDGDQALRLLGGAPCDVLLLGLALRGPSHDLEVVEAVRHRNWVGRVLIVSGTNDAAVMARALELGADGFISKQVDPTALHQAVLRVASGQVALPADAVRSVVHELALLREHRSRSEQILLRLSPREQEALRLLAVGKGTSVIARELGISLNTVRTHLAHVRAKLNVHSQLEAAARGRELFAVDLETARRRIV